MTRSTKRFVRTPFTPKRSVNNMRPLTQQERDAVQFVISHTYTGSNLCMEIASIMQWKLNAGEIKAYSAQTMRAAGDMHTKTGEAHIFEPAQRGASELGWTTLHEGAHFRGYSSETGAEAIANFCWMGD
jgi:hypothetical protein